MSLTPGSRLVLDPHVRFRRFAEDGVIVDQKSAEALVVNEVAARLLELSDGARTLGDCIDIMRTEFAVERDVIEGDMLRFADELVSAGLVEVAS